MSILSRSLIPPAVVILFICGAQARQDDPGGGPNHKIRVFLDCESCDDDHMRTEITFVDYVRDREQGDVHLLITYLTTGGGGREYTCEFRGLGRFSGTNDTIVFNTGTADTEEMRREHLIRYVKLGLVKYAASTPAAGRLDVTYKADSEAPPPIGDNWDYWVFKGNVRMYLNGEQSTSYTSVNGSVSANRVTEDLKLNIAISGNYNQSDYDYEDYAYTDISRSGSASVFAVKSLGGHWSAGSSASLAFSTYSNLKSSLAIAPSLEYNIFPYSETTRRQFRIRYRISAATLRYEDETIFFKTSEVVGRQGLYVTLEMKEPWGSTEVSINGSHILSDVKKYEIGFYGELSLRIFEGLSLEMNGGIFRTRDQISLRKGIASQEEVLLRRRELESQYNYWVSWGISYSFGSIFNNVVNYRMGSGSSGVIYY